MVFSFLSPHLHWGALRVGVASLNCLWMSLGQCCLPPLTGAATVAGMKFGFSFSWSGEKELSPLRRWGQCNCLPPSLVLPQHFVKNLSTVDFIQWRDFLLPDCASFSCVPLKIFFFIKNQEKLPCFILFVFQKKCFNTYSMICSRLHLPVLLPSVSIQPARLFFIKPSPYLRYLSSESIKPLPSSLTFHTVRLNHPSYSRSSENYRQAAELK